MRMIIWGRRARRAQTLLPALASLFSRWLSWRRRRVRVGIPGYIDVQRSPFRIRKMTHHPQDPRGWRSPLTLPSRLCYGSCPGGVIDLSSPARPGRPLSRFPAGASPDATPPGHSRGPALLCVLCKELAGQASGAIKEFFTLCCGFQPSDHLVRTYVQFAGLSRRPRTDACADVTSCDCHLPCHRAFHGAGTRLKPSYTIEAWSWL
jgi:hypothetical protein